MSEARDQAKGQILSDLDAFADVVEEETAAPLQEIIDTQTGTIATQGSTIGTLEATVALKDETIAALQAALDACRGGQSITTLFGMSEPDHTAGLGDVPVGRAYLAPGKRPTSVSAAPSAFRTTWGKIAPGGVFWLSAKDKPAAWTDSLLSDLLTQRPDVTLYVTSRHEPYDDLYATGAAGIRTYHEYNDALESILRNYDSEQVQGWTVWEGWHRPSRSPDYYNDMLRPSQRIGFDQYNLGIQNPTQGYVDPAELFDELLDYAADHGTAVSAIAETGSGPYRGDTAGRSQWLRDLKSYLAGKVSVAAVWNSGTCTMTLPEAEAWIA